MANLRFSTVQQVVDASPPLKGEFKGQDLQLHPVDMVRALVASGQIPGALALCAYMLPRREAAHWLCESLRLCGAAFDEADETLLKLAETWVKNSSEKNRSAALSAAMESGFLSAASWAAAAVGWSGGNIGFNPEKPVPPSPHLTGQAVKAGFTVAYWNLYGETRETQAAAAVQRALAIVQVAN